MGFRLIVSLAIPLVAALYILHFNRGAIPVHLTEAWVVHLPFVTVVLISALAGAFLASVLGWTEAGFSGLARWREGRRIRRKERAVKVLDEAETLRTKGQIRAARRKARKASRLDPQLPAAFMLAGDLATEAGDLTEAIRCNERLFYLSPESLETLVRLSSNLEAAGRAKDAEKVLVRMGENGKVHPDVLRRLRDIFASQGRWEEALSTARKLSDFWASDTLRVADQKIEGDLFMSMGETRLVESNAKEAVSFFEEAVHRLPSEVDPRLRLGDALRGLGRNKRAIRAWEEGYKHLGHSVFLRRIVACHEPESDPKGKRHAASAMLTCGRMKEEDPLPFVMAAALLFDNGETKEAQKWIETASTKAVGSSCEGDEELWVGVVLGLLEARAKLEGGDRLAAESAFQKVAQQASRKILGEHAPGIVIRPVESVPADQ